MAGDLAQLIALGRLAGNTLGLPAHIQQATAQQQALRNELQSVPGLAPADVEAATPGVPLQFLNPDVVAKSSIPASGTIGKILGGVGDVGQLVSAIFGGSVGAPRVPIHDLAALQTLKNAGEKSAGLKAYADTLQNPSAKALAPYNPAAAATIERGETSRPRSETALVEELSRTSDPARRQELQSALDTMMHRSKERTDYMTGSLEQRQLHMSDIQRAGKIKDEAAKHLMSIREVQNTTYPIMAKAQQALSTNPLIAKSGAQTFENWVRSAQGDEGAAALKALFAQRAMLGRTVDVGALTETDLKPWDAFVNGNKMTYQEFAAMGRILHQVLGARAKVHEEAMRTGTIPPLDPEYANGPTGAGGSQDKGGDDDNLNLLQELYRSEGH